MFQNLFKSIQFKIIKAIAADYYSSFLMLLFIYFKNNRNQSSVRLVDLIIIKFEEKGQKQKGAISMNTPKLFAYHLIEG